MFKFGDVARHGQSLFNHSAVPFRGGISVLELRLDGFSSLRSVATWGSKAQATTLLLRTHGTALRINMEAAVGAWLTVTILDANGQPLPGLSADQCVQLGGNLLDAEVVWRQDKGARSLGTVTEPFRLQFFMNGAVNLYSFRFSV